MSDPQSVWSLVRPIVFFGWAIATVRLAMVYLPARIRRRRAAAAPQVQ